MTSGLYPLISIILKFNDCTNILQNLFGEFIDFIVCEKVCGQTLISVTSFTDIHFNAKDEIFLD